MDAFTKHNKNGFEKWKEENQTYKIKALIFSLLHSTDIKGLCQVVTNVSMSYS